MTTKLTTMLKWTGLTAEHNAGSFEAIGTNWNAHPCPRGWVLFEGNVRRGTFPTLAEAMVEADRLVLIASLRHDARKPGAKGALARTMLEAVKRGEPVVVDGRVVIAEGS